jgi:hypothetical protein
MKNEQENNCLQAGFNKGDGSGEHFSLPTSGTGNIMYLEEYGNTGIPGEWMFELDDEHIVRCKVGIKGDTCDEGRKPLVGRGFAECSAMEWGADCAKCCHCAESVGCDSVSGACPGACSDCWTGAPNCQMSMFDYSLVITWLFESGRDVRPDQRPPPDVPTMPSPSPIRTDAESQCNGVNASQATRETDICNASISTNAVCLELATNGQFVQIPPDDSFVSVSRDTR